MLSLSTIKLDNFIVSTSGYQELLQRLESGPRVIGAKGTALVGIKWQEGARLQKIGDVVIAKAMPAEEIP